MVINGCASGVILVIVAPETFNIHAGREKLIAASLAFGLWNTGNFLKRSPLPGVTVGEHGEIEMDDDE